MPPTSDRLRDQAAKADWVRLVAIDSPFIHTRPAAGSVGACDRLWASCCEDAARRLGFGLWP